MKKLFMVGNTHIDPVWLWKRAEGMQEVKSSFASALDRMEEFPDFKFTHSSIGYHEHLGETEPYYIVSGHGTFIDHDQTRIPVGPDDVCLIACGQSHGFENDSDEELVMMALVYNE